MLAFPARTRGWRDADDIFSSYTPIQRGKTTYHPITLRDVAKRERRAGGSTRAQTCSRSRQRLEDAHRFWTVCAPFAAIPSRSRSFQQEPSHARYLPTPLLRPPSTSTHHATTPGGDATTVCTAHPLLRASTAATRADYATYTRVAACAASRKGVYATTLSTALISIGKIS